MGWKVSYLDAAVGLKIAGLLDDMQARLRRIADMIELALQRAEQ